MASSSCLRYLNAVQLYVDGQPSGLRADWDIDGQPAAPGDVKFGCASVDFPTGSPYFRGAIDDVRVYRAALSADEIGDADGLEPINNTDGIFILNYLFLGGEPPPPPFADCGEDPTDDASSCETAPPNCR